MCSLVLEMLGCLDGWRGSQKRMALPPDMLVIPEQAQSLCLCRYRVRELFWWCKTGERKMKRLRLITRLSFTKLFQKSTSL